MINIFILYKGGLNKTMKETNIYDSINENTICPICFKNRFWL